MKGAALALTLLFSFVAMALPAQRAWAEGSICGYAYLEPNSDDPGMYTLVIQKERRTGGGVYQELGPVLEDATAEDDLPWHDPQEKREMIAAVKVDGSTGFVSPTSTSYWFYQCWNARSFDLSGLDTSNVTDMSNMFGACDSVRSLDLSGLKTSNVTSMANMVAGCLSLKSLNLSGIDTSKVTSMAGMMNSCLAIESVDLSGLNTSSVTSMEAMFASCVALASVDVAGIDTSNVTSMISMFQGCSSLTELDLSALDTSSLIDTWYMFDGCSSLASVDLSSFDFLKIRSTERMFFGCVALESLDMSRCGTESLVWHYAAEMFTGCRSLTSVSFPRAERYALSSVRDMFKGCYSLESIDFSNVALPEGHPESPSGAFVSSGLHEVTIGPNLAVASVLEGLLSLSSTWAVKGDVSRVFSSAEDMLAAVEAQGASMTFVASGDPKGIFAYEETATRTLVICPQWKALAAGEREFGVVTGNNVPWADDSSSFERARIEPGVAPVSTAKWFYDCNNLTAVEGMENLDTSNVTDMSSMFFNCKSLATLDVGKLETSLVTDFSDMFGNCAALSELDVSGFDTGRATTFYGMFAYCESLALLDVSGFDTAKASRFGYMFSGCSSLASLDVSGFQTSAASGVDGMFAGCAGLTSLDVSDFDLAKTNNASYLFSGCTSLSSLQLFELDCSRWHGLYLYKMFSNCSSLREVDLTRFELDSDSISDTPNWGLEDFFSGCDSLERVKVSSASTVLPVFPEGMWAAVGTDIAHRHDAVPAGVDATYAKKAGKPYYHVLLSADGTLSIAAQPVAAGVGERFYRLLDEGYASAADIPWHDRANRISAVTVAAGVRPQSVAHWFEGCTELTSVDLSGLDTSGVSDFSSMFYGCSSLEALDLSGFDTRTATSMRRMFHGCRSLESVKIGDKFTFRGSAWSRLPGSELPSGAWQQVDALGGAIDADHAYASDSIPSFEAAAYRKADETQPGLTIASIRGDTAIGATKYTVETQLVQNEAGELEAVSNYILDESYASDEFAIGDASKASSYKLLSNKTVTSTTVRNVESKNVTTIRIGPQVAKIKKEAFAASPKVTRLEIQSDKLTTSGSVKNCLKGSKVNRVAYDSRMKKKAKVKYAFEHYAGKKVK